MSQILGDGQGPIDQAVLERPLIDLANVDGSLLVSSILEGDSTDLPTVATFGHRLAYDRFGDGFYFILEDDVSPTALTPTEVRALNNENEDVAFTVSAVSGLKTKIVGLLFDLPVTLTGYNVVALDSGSWMGFEKSTDTTDGMDGTWTEVEDPASGAYLDGAVNPEFLTRTKVLEGVINVRGVRLLHNGNTDIDMLSFHVYGGPGTLADPDRMRIWSPTEEEVIDANGLNFGNSPRRSSADLRFRVKNTSPFVTAVAVTVGLDGLNDHTSPDPDRQFLLSEDNGRTFAGDINIGTLAPGQVSSLLTLRRVTPSNADVGQWTARLLVSAAGGVEEWSEYVYYEANDGVPTPHIWYIYPPSGQAGDSVQVVGFGFGTAQATYGGVVQYADVNQAILDWDEVAAGGSAYTGARAIQSPNDVVNVEHQRILVAVPALAADDYFQVETNG